MSNIFLTSVGANVLDKILSIINKNPHNLRLLFIPTAANINDDKSCVIKDKNKLKSLGFQIIELDISNTKSDDIKKAVSDIDVLYVCGGNTFYLLQELRKTRFDKILKELINSNIIYIGSSAGSAVLCPTIEYLKEIDDYKLATELKSFKGLNIVDFLLFPHYDDKMLKEKFDSIKQKYVDKYEFLNLSDNQFVFIDNHKKMIFTKDN